MMERLRRAVLKLNVLNERVEKVKLGRTATALAGVLARSPGKAAARLAGIDAMAALHAWETGTWVEAPELAEGRGGAFDAADLRHWLALAERAGVPFVPAKEILSLSEEEAAFASGSVPMPEGKGVDRIRERLAALPEIAESPEEARGEEPGGAFDRGDAQAVAALQERVDSAMDAVPEGWMVRSARCGGSELKALAGAGAAGFEVPETRFGPDLQVGPGWFRIGNRRSVNVSDTRTVEAYAKGPVGRPLVFLARPWVEAGRYAVGEDPQRHGTQYAGKGMWPAEWRAFVERDVVVGVSSYYGWCGSVTEENARIAIEVRDLAQRIVDEAVRQRAYPRFMDIEFIRGGARPQVAAMEWVKEAMDLFGRESVACTLDFIETKEGLMLLEGGPPSTHVGGAHPCAFAGCGGPPTNGNKPDVRGVAFRVMEGVVLGDPRTWQESSRENCILGWDEVEAIASASPPAPGP